MDAKIERGMYGVLLLLAFASNISTGATSFAICVGAILMILQGIVRKQWPIVDRRLFQVVLVYCIAQCLIAAFSLEPRISFHDAWATTYRFLPLFFALIYIRTERQVWQLCLVFLLSLLIDVAAGGYQYVILHEVRVNGLNNAPTLYSSFMLMGIGMAIFLVQAREAAFQLRCLAFLALLGAVWMLLASGARGAWLAMGGMLLLLLCAAGRRHKKLLAGVLVSLVCFGGLMYVFASAVWRPYSTVDERLCMWKSALHIAADYPVLGAGQDEFGRLYNTKYILPEAKERAKTDDPRSGHGHPHNNLMKIASEGGIVGILAYFFLHGYIFYQLFCQYREEKEARLPFFALAGFLVFGGLHMEGFSDTNINQVPIMREYWLLMGIVLAAGKVFQNRRNSSAG